MWKSYLTFRGPKTAHLGKGSHFAIVGIARYSLILAVFFTKRPTIKQQFLQQEAGSSNGVLKRGLH